MFHLRKKWPLNVAFWYPNPKNVLHINKDSLIETRRQALRLRRSIVENKINTIKSNLLKLELDQLAQMEVNNTQNILHDLQTLENVVMSINEIDNQTKSPTSPTPSSNMDDGDSTSGGFVYHHKKNEFIISISPDGPSFSVDTNFRTEFLSGLYHRQTQWLPFYGQWFSSMTDSAMQRRVFPKELKGNINFQNSTSLKLITSVLDTLASVTDDIYTDIRHLTDINSALCLINGYYCISTSSKLPNTYEDLLTDLDKKIEFLVGDLKHDTSQTDFSYVYSNPKQLETIAPLNKHGTYAADFFNNHKLFYLMNSVGMFAHNKQTQSERGLPTTKDIVYLITNNVFSQDIPPFLTHRGGR